MTNSVAVSPPCPVGYWRVRNASFRTLSFDVLSASMRRSPSFGAKAAT